jgi:hypothetical protein
MLKQPGAGDKPKTTRKPAEMDENLNKDTSLLTRSIFQRTISYFYNLENIFKV